MLDVVLAELYSHGTPAGNWRARVEAGRTEAEMDLLVALVDGFVRGAAGEVPARSAAAQRSCHPERFPTAARVAPLAGDPAPGRSFEFGLERLLDGIGVLILNASR